MIVLKERCKCGGKILVITFREFSETYGKTVSLVSHGQCVKCQKNIVLPGGAELYELGDAVEIVEDLEEDND